jgi:zinc/manganese transport system substrate-binding protein
VVLGIVVALALIGGGCGSGPAAGAGRGPILVLAAENFWGSIAAQLGGPRVEVQSVITNPNADPHDYEPTASDGRAAAEADYVIENGVGYDPWMAQLVAANGVGHQRVLSVGALVGAQAGDNPHRWYFPSDVEAVATRITADYRRLDPTHAAYYNARRRAFETTGLAEYHRVIHEIRTRYAGTAVGASESIFVGLAQATHLDLVTPARYLRAISQGIDPTASDTATVADQIARGDIKVWVYNSQNATPDIQSLTAQARSAGIPVTTITETMVPSGGSFQAWQVRELRSLMRALARATGR